VPANLVRVATDQACRVALAARRVKPGARIVRSCCLVRALQLLPVAAWPVGRAAWFAVICWPITAARAVICCLVNAAARPARPAPGTRHQAPGTRQQAAAAAWSVFVFVLLVGPCL